MRSFTELWPTLKRLLAYGSPWRKPLAIAVAMMWIAAAAEVSGPLLGEGVVNGMKSWFTVAFRSEERRVGKECRSRWSPYH